MDYKDLLKTHCAAKPDAVEDHPWGETVFKVRNKVFAFLGSSEAAMITVRPEEDRDGLLQLPYVRVAAYIGRYGWVTVTVEDDAALELALDLIDQNYARLTRTRSRSRRGAPPDST